MAGKVTAQSPEVQALLELERRDMQAPGTMPAPLKQKLTAFRQQGIIKQLDSGGSSTTEGERKADSFLKRALGANKDYEGVGIGPRSLIGQAVADKVPNLLNSLPSVVGNSPERQIADTTQDEFIAASLRQDSGAAIPDAELEKQRRIYFPMPGDGPEVIAQKRKARRRAIEGLVSSGGAAISPEDRATFEQWIKDFDKPAATETRKENIGLQAGIERTIDEAAGLKPDQPLPTPDYLDEAAQTTFARLTPSEQRAWANGEANFPGLPLTANITAKDEPEPPKPPSELDKERDTVIGAADAAVRGAVDVGSFGFSDEIAAAGKTVFGGGTMADNLRSERAIADSDERVNPWARFGGQLGAGILLPWGKNARTAGQMAKVGGGMGAAYGFGSGEDGFVDRLKEGAVGGTAGIALGYGGAKAAPMIETALTRFTRPSAARQARETLMEAADKLDVQMLPADVGGVGSRMATGAFGRTLGGIPIAEAATRGVQQAGRARDRIAGTLGRVTDETSAGQAAQRGAKAFETQSEARAAELYDAISVPPTASADLATTRNALDELTQGLKSNPKLSKLWAENPRLQQTLDALTPDASGVGGQLSWEDLKRFRSIVGEISGKPSMADDGNAIKSMKKLYAALSTDMEATAARSGPRALTEFRRANQYWRGRENRIENVLVDIVGKNYQKGEADAFAQINNWAQKQGGDFKRLAASMRSLPADEANTVRATLFGRMGQASPGQQAADGMVFSSAKFATEWQKLDPLAKSVLFPNKAHRENIDRLVLVTTGQKRAGQFQNFSNTALGVNATAGAAGMFVEPFTTLTALGTQFAVGKLLASPRFAKWLASPPRSRTQVAAWSRQLSTIAARDPAIAAEVGQFQQILSRAVNDNGGGITRAAASGEAPDERK